MSTAARLAEEAKAMFEQADRENRALTADERVYAKDLVDRAKERGQYERQFKQIDLPGVGNVFTDPIGASVGGGSPGEMFASSEAYKSIRDSRSRGDNWT